MAIGMIWAIRYREKEWILICVICVSCRLFKMHVVDSHFACFNTTHHSPVHRIVTTATGVRKRLKLSSAVSPDQRIISFFNYVQVMDLMTDDSEAHRQNRDFIRPIH